MRMTMRVAMMAAALALCLPLHFLWILFGRHSPWPRLFLGWVGYAAGARVRIIGRPLAHHILFLCNHLSWLDIMLVAGATGTAFVSKDDVADWPLFGWLARLNRTVFVGRTQRGAARDQADALRKALLTGLPVALFPEGTTDGGVTILPFRASLLAALFPPVSGLKVQFVALDYGLAGHDVAWVASEPAASNVKRLLTRKGTIPVTITFFQPVDPAHYADRKALAQAAQQEIAKALSPSAASRDSL